MRTLIVQSEITPSPSPFLDIFPSIAADLASRDQVVTLFNSDRELNQSIAGVATVNSWSAEMISGQSKIKRFFGRSLFSLQLFLHAVLRFKPYDVLLVRNSPPIWIGITAMLIQFFRGTKFVYQISELYPEAAAIRDEGQVGSRMDLAEKIERWICDTAKTVIVPTMDMVDTLRDRGVQNESVTLLSCNVHQVPDPETQLPEDLHRKFDRFRVIYIGKMSAAENLEFVCDAAFLLRDRQDIEFIFVGDGPQKTELQELCGPMNGKTVFFHDWLNAAKASSLVATADLAIVSLMPKMLEAMYPANVSLYQSGGCEILACIDQDSDLAETIQRQQLGIVLDRRSSRAIADEINGRADTWRDRGNSSSARRQFPLEQQAREAEAWCDALEQIGEFAGDNDVAREAPAEIL